MSFFVYELQVPKCKKEYLQNYTSGGNDMLVSKPKSLKVNVVDSIMGSGKTSWAIQYMNESSLNKRFIFITPFKKEIDRVINSMEREFVQPEVIQAGRKIDSLKKLIKEGKDIVSTHALFLKMDDELIDLIEIQGYTLILDEVIKVVENVKISQDDLKLLLSAKNYNGDPVITVKSNGFVQWNDTEYRVGNFKKILDLANAGNLMIHNNTAMYWLFPIEVFSSFEEVYILTYLFHGQIQRYYFDLFEVTYDFYSVRKIDGSYKLIDYIPLENENRDHLSKLIHIHYSKITDKNDLNRIGKGRGPFSKSHLEKLVGTKSKRDIIKNNAYNYYRHKLKVPTEAVMWTTFKDLKQKLQPTGLKDQFVAVTAKATNDYADKSVCIYLANRFMNPVTKQFFTSRSIDVNEDLFALSELVQWIFRSRIRKGEDIHIYVPSERMRNILEKYLRK